MSLNRKTGSSVIKTVAVGLLVSFSGLAWAQDAPSECVESGALAFDEFLGSRHDDLLAHRLGVPSGAARRTGRGWWGRTASR